MRNIWNMPRFTKGLKKGSRANIFVRTFNCLKLSKILQKYSGCQYDAIHYLSPACYRACTSVHSVYIYVHASVFLLEMREASDGLW